jgi:hypothetical protein
MLFGCLSKSPSLVEEANPVVPGEALEKILFGDMHKKGFLTGAEYRQKEQEELTSGKLPVGSRIIPGLYTRNKGCYLKGVRVVVDGWIVNQGIISKPKMIISTDTCFSVTDVFSSPKSYADAIKSDLNKPQDLDDPVYLSREQDSKAPQAFRDARKSSQCIAIPITEKNNGKVIWVVDAPEILVRANGQLNIFLHCITAKSGSGEIMFRVYSLENPGQPLIRHEQTIRVSPGNQDGLPH